jgi:hypothetical protein
MLNYPGFNFSQYFESPAVPIPLHQSKTFSIKFEKDTVDFVYNSYGYRTKEFDADLQDYIVIAGCSLSEGHGLHLDQTWGKKLERAVNQPVINLAKGGANAEFVSQNLTNWLHSNFKKPGLVIAQWPNPFRSTHWHEGKALFLMNQNADDLYKLKVKHGQEYFYLSWVANIINLNNKCRSLRIPVLHLCFEHYQSIYPMALNILQQNNIDLHLDLKEQNFTWHFDNKALDNNHHSEWCHEQWAKRIYNLAKPILVA